MKNILLELVFLFLPMLSLAQIHEQDKRIDGVSGIVGAGEFMQDHPDKFFSTFNGNNVFNIPQLYLSEQKFLGNTLRLGRRSGFYFMSGIMYGAQLGVHGNNWGMGSREGCRIAHDHALELLGHRSLHLPTRANRFLIGLARRASGCRQSDDLKIGMIFQERQETLTNHTRSANDANLHLFHHCIFLS